MMWLEVILWSVILVWDRFHSLVLSSMRTNVGTISIEWGCWNMVRSHSKKVMNDDLLV
jgi:hypothetical protein